MIQNNFFKRERERDKLVVAMLELEASMNFRWQMLVMVTIIQFVITQKKKNEKR